MADTNIVRASEELIELLQAFAKYALPEKGAEAFAITTVLAELEAYRRADAEPTAYGIAALIGDTDWVLQFPLCASKEEAEEDMKMYAKDAPLRMVKLYTSPFAAQEE